MRKNIYSFALMCIMLVASVATAYAQASCAVDPTPGSVVNSLKRVTLTYASGTVADFGSKYQEITVTGGSLEAPVVCTLEYGTSDNQLKITFSEITEKGNYTVNVPADAITVDNVSQAAFTIDYTVGQDIASGSTIIPAPGNVKWLDQIVFYNTVVEGLGKSLSANNMVHPTITDPAGNTARMQSVYDYQIGAGKYRYNICKLAAAPGEYTITFPEQSLYFTDEFYQKQYIPACSFKFNVQGGTLTNVTSTPTGSVTEYKTMTVTFPDYTSIKGNYTGNIYIWKEGKEESYVSSLLINSGKIEGNTFSYTSYSSIIEPGHYYATFPEGCFLLGANEEPCTPFLVEFDIVDPTPTPMVVTVPETGVLNKCTITFPEKESVELGTPSVYMIREKDDKSGYITVCGAYTSGSYSKVAGKDNAYEVKFNGLATASGEYKIVVQKYSFTYENGYNAQDTIAFQHTTPAPIAMTISPADGSALDKIQKFEVSFDTQKTVIVNPTLQNKTSTLYVGAELTPSQWGGYTNSQAGSASNYTAVEGKPNTFSFTLSSAVINKDDYTLLIPAGIFIVGDDETFSAAGEFHYSCTGEGLDKLKVNPDYVVKALQDVSITFINETAISFNGQYANVTLYKEVEGQTWATWLESVYANQGMTINGNTANIHLSKQYTDPGHYYIAISQYSFFMSDGTTASTPQNVYFDVDPVTAVEEVNVVPASDNRIFNLQGIELKSMDAPGIYIQNGKKVVK